MAYTTRTPLFFLSTPFTEEFRQLRQLIGSSLEEVGVKPLLLEETLVAGVPVATSIQKAIELADVVIVDVTGNNPNVLFETGFAVALGKPVLPIVQQGFGSVPSDVSSRLYLVYDPAEPRKLSNDIKKWALSYLRRENSRSKVV